MTEGKQSRTKHESKATEPSQLQPDTPREAPAHRSVSWTRTQKRLTAELGRQDEPRQETTRESRQHGNTETCTRNERSTQNRKGRRARGAKESKKTQIPPGTTRKDTQKRQKGGRTSPTRQKRDS